MSQTKEQRNASIAYENVKKHHGKEYADKYGIQAHKFPILVRTAGLVAALEFLDTRKEKNGPKQFLADLNEHSKKLGLVNSSKTLKETAMEGDLSVYLLLTREVSQLATWYKRFSVSILDVEAGSEG